MLEQGLSDKPRRMGRPPLGVKLTTVRLAKAVMDRIDALCGPNRRGEFIREAVERELTRRESGKDDAAARARNPKAD